MTRSYTYQDILDASQWIDWRVEDLIGGDRHLDFSKPFMPEALARVEALTFLTPREQLVLNQVRGHNYLSLFGLVATMPGRNSTAMPTGRGFCCNLPVRKPNTSICSRASALSSKLVSV